MPTVRLRLADTADAAVLLTLRDEATGAPAPHTPDEYVLVAGAPPRALPLPYGVALHLWGVATATTWLDHPELLPGGAARLSLPLDIALDRQAFRRPLLRGRLTGPEGVAPVALDGRDGFVRVPLPYPGGTLALAAEPAGIGEAMP